MIYFIMRPSLEGPPTWRCSAGVNIHVCAYKMYTRQSEASSLIDRIRTWCNLNGGGEKKRREVRAFFLLPSLNEKGGFLL